MNKYFNAVLLYLGRRAALFDMGLEGGEHMAINITFERYR